MDAKAFSDVVDRDLATAPLDRVPQVLKHCWSVERLAAVYNAIKQDTDRRLALISHRMDQIRGS